MSDVPQGQTGWTAPASSHVERVATTVTTSSTFAPAQPAQPARHTPPPPMQQDHASMSRLGEHRRGDDDAGYDEVEEQRGPSDYALLRLAPAQTTTVVTTTTTTTTHFAPIRLPKSAPIQATRSSFSAPSAGAPLSPRAAVYDFYERAEGQSSSSSSAAAAGKALLLDRRMYPLSQARWPDAFKQWHLTLGAMKATFSEDGADVPLGRPRASTSHAHLDEGGAPNAIEHTRRYSAVSMQEPSPPTGRGSGDDSRGSAYRLDANPFSASEGDRRMNHGHGHVSPGPPRKRPRIQTPPPGGSSANLHLHAPAAAAAPRRLSLQQNYLSNAGAPAALPSPNQSPPSPVPTSGGEEEQEMKDGEEEEEAPHIAAVSAAHAQQFDFGTGAALSGLLSLPDLVQTFSQLPDAMQSYLLFQLLRRSSVPVLQLINQIVEPALRRDFLSDLPPELGTIILGHLDARDLCRSSLVCKTWRRMIDGEWRVWKDKLVSSGLWVGDGSDEREAREAATGKKEDLFLRRWEAGVWDEHRRTSWTGKVEPVSLYYSGAAEPREESVSYRLASPSSSRSASPAPSNHFAHPFKLLYRARVITRRNWAQGTPARLVFQSSNLSASQQQQQAQPPPAQQAGANQPPPAPAANNHVVTCLQFDSQKIVSASDDHSISVFDTQTGRRRADLVGHDGGVWAMQYVGNVLVSGSTDKSVRVWDLKTGRCSHVFVGHKSTVRCLQVVEPENINPDPAGDPIWEPAYPLIVTGSRDWSLRVWKLPMPNRDPDYSPPPYDYDATEIDVSDNPYHLRHLTGHEHAVRALSAHGRTLVSGSYDMMVRVWDILTGECRHILRGHTQKVYSVVYDSIRKQCASGSMDGTVRLWSTETGECRAVLEGHTSLVGLLGLTHRNLVSAAADWTLRIWDPETGACRHTLAAHGGAITCFQQDEHKVISGSDGTLKMWDVRTGALVRDLITNLTGVWQVAADRRYCVAAVSRGGRSEYEILDFGAVDPPATSATMSPAVKTEDVDDNVPAASFPGRFTDARSQNRAQETPDAGRSTAVPSAPRLPALAFQPTTTTAVLASHTPVLSGAGTPSRSTSTHRAVRRMSNSRDLHAQASNSAGSADAGPSTSRSSRPAGVGADDTVMDESVAVKEEDVDES
ncbi:hypothetical protein JCM10908_001154 [Rhodotorula pacifica]|uniref:F-box/WD repeat-containing protein n=1 Tax=Rhodotorula pacifica TaxID=1495444 RepID=UPI00317572FC